MKLNITALTIHYIIFRMRNSGEIPSERHMVLEVGVSRQIIRNALLLLWYDGAIEINHGKPHKPIKPPTDEFMVRINEMYGQ